MTRWNLVDLTRGAFLIFIFSMVGACSRTAALHFSGRPNQESAKARRSSDVVSQETSEFLVVTFFWKGSYGIFVVPKW